MLMVLTAEINNTEVELYKKAPSDESEMDEFIMQYNGYKTDVRYSNFKIKKCEYEIINNMFVEVTNVIKEWDLPLEE